MINNQRPNRHKLNMDSDENFSSMLHRNMALNTITLFSKWTSLSLLLICVSLFSCKDGSSEQTAQQSTNKVEEEQVDNTTTSGNKVILFYGNSLTAGYGLDENESFPSLIEDKIDSLNLPYSVVNAGLSGETTSGGLKRIDWVMKQKVDIFFLELGANDMLRGLPLDQTKTNLSEIISIVKAKNPNVVIGLCEMMAPPNMGEIYVSEFSKIYQDLSDSYDVKFIPFFLEGVAGNPDLLLKDGKHPNANGQVIVAENIWKHLEPML